MMKRFLASLIAFSVPLMLAAQVREVQLNHQPRRPLSEAAELFETQYGWIVTYEDVPVVGDDIEDVTEQTRPLSPNASYRTLVPKMSMPVAFSFDEGKAKLGDVGAPAVIAAAVDAYNNSGNPGKFRGLAIRAANGGPMVYHLVPYEMRDVHGRPQAYIPPLDTRISVASGKRSLDQILGEIESQLKSATGLKIAAGVGTSNYLMQTNIEFQAKDEPARDVLRHLLIEKAGRLFSWWMFCDPHGDQCALNIHEVGRGHSY